MPRIMEKADVLERDRRSKMTEPKPSPIQIQDFDGVRTPFDPLALQTRLIGCFLAAGRQESSPMAEDFALAVEYTLSRAPRPEPVFGRGELDSAVTAMLEETGFPDVARIFRQHGTESIVEIGTDRETVANLLQKHLACPEERFDAVLQETLSALGKLELLNAPPRLILELARCIERRMYSAAPCRVGSHAPAVTMTRQDIFKVLPPEAKPLVSAGILRISGITTLFARIHFFFLMNEFARSLQLKRPVTELELEPLLYRAGQVLEAARSAIVQAVGSDVKLPTLLAVPDMLDFIVEYTGGDRDHAERLGAELATALASEFRCDLYKLTFQ